VGAGDVRPASHAPKASRRSSPNEPYADTVYASLKDGVVKGTLAPGERLREEELARRFRVSRTPVREALGKLEVEGLVANRPGRGLVVAELGHEEIVEIYVLREVLEGAATRLAAERATELDLARLGLVLQAIDEATDERADERVVRLNADFHHIIWRVAGNRRLLKLLNDLQDAIRRFQRLTLLYPGRMEQALEEHRALFDAIRRRDSAAAEAIAREHMRQVLKIRIALSVARDPASAEG
jgi:DNA-binding GntR family transcriptional regulator